MTNSNPMMLHNLSSRHHVRRTLPAGMVGWQGISKADNLLKSNQEVFQVTFNGPVTFTVVSSPARPAQWAQWWTLTGCSDMSEINEEMDDINMILTWY